MFKNRRRVVILEKALERDLTEKGALEERQELERTAASHVQAFSPKEESPKQEKICFFWMTPRRSVLSG